MTMNPLCQERIQLFKDAISQVKKPDRVPYFGNIWTWKIYNAGYTVREAIYDYRIMQKVLDHTFETFPIDCYYELGWRNPLQVTDVLGSEDYQINDLKNTIQMRDHFFMEDGEYGDLIANPKKFLWETILPRKYKNLSNSNNSDVFKMALEKYQDFNGFLMESSQRMITNYGIPVFADPDPAIDYWGNGYELLFCILRGIKGLSHDIKRDPQKVLAAIEALDQTFVVPRLQKALLRPKGTSMSVCVDVNPVLLGHSILGPKHFEKFYWPHLKRIADYAIEQDKLVYFFVESDSKRFWDFFRTLPKGHFAIHSELDDVFEMKKNLPNLCIAGGMKASLLAEGTTAECLTYAQKLLEELSSEGGYIFSENKMLTFKRDCRPENLKAVSEFVRDYRG